MLSTLAPSSKTLQHVFNFKHVTSPTGFKDAADVFNIKRVLKCFAESRPKRFDGWSQGAHHLLD